MAFAFVNKISLPLLMILIIAVKFVEMVNYIFSLAMMEII